MKKYESMHGFEFIKASPCPDLDATLVEFRHKTTHAPLLFLDRKDENMTFGIGFRTVPTDDTGVFHILEHSVLCGSKKYPVKDPFSELLKGSSSTFLNAFTYGDRTVYPVSSMNKKAFLDLTDVYLDAVLHPLALENENIFLQEGHRLELTEDGRLERNGIVYNEMRGAYGSPDEIAAYYEGHLVFEGGCYGQDSGGFPAAIPGLTYEQFKNTHKKYYHPTNSVIFLDGSVDLDAVLPLINSHLGEYGIGEKFDEIPEGNGIKTDPLTVHYPVETAEDEKDATRIILLRRFGSHSDKRLFTAVNLASEAISDGNSSPLKRAIVDSGLCKNFSFYPVGGMKYPVFATRFTDVADGKEDELLAIYRQTLDDILKNGIDPEAVRAALNSTEFQTREADFGTYPRGLVYLTSVIEDYMCGDDPTSTLNYNELFTFLRSKLDTPHYTEVLADVFAGDREAMLILRPSATVAEKEAADEAEKMAAILADMTDTEIEKIKAQSAALELWQSTPDTKEAVDTIPTLAIEDLSRDVKQTPTDITEVDGVKVISHPIPTGGISYLCLFFDISEIDEDDLTAISVMTLCYTDFDTENYTSGEMRNRIKASLGGLTMGITPIKIDGNAKLYLQISLSTLDENKDTAIALAKEFIYGRKYEGEEILKKRIRQVVSGSKDALASAANALCIALGAAQFDAFEALKELSGGITLFLKLKEIDKNNGEGELLQRFTRICRELLTRSRLTVSLAGEYDTDFIKKVIATVTEGGNTPGACQISPLKKENIGVAIPSQVSYATVISNLYTAGGMTNGSLMTLGTILDYELLWNEIRVKGGAYGTGFICRPNSGTTGAYSYRDPSPKGSLSVFEKIPAMIADFLAATPDLTRYIVGTVGSIDTVDTPRRESATATQNYLSGKTHAEILRYRQECIDTTPADIARNAEMLSAVLKNATNIVAGPREQLATLGLDKIIEL